MVLKHELLDLDHAVEYTMRGNVSYIPSILAGASVYGGSHAIETTAFDQYAGLAWTLPMQAHFENAIIRHRLPAHTGPQAVKANIRRLPTWGHYDYHGKDTSYKNMAPMYLLFMVSSIVCELLQELLAEKENKFKMNLQIAGLPDWGYWCTWWKQMMTTMAGLCVFVTVACILVVYSNSNAGLVFVFFFLSCGAFISVTLAISACLFSAAIGSMAGTLVTGLMAFPSTVIGDSSTALPVKYLFCLFPPATYMHGLTLFADHELPYFVTDTPGIHFQTMWEKGAENDVSIGECILFLLLDTVFYMALAWYLEKVVPDQWGKHMPAGFIFTSKYWFPEQFAAKRREKDELKKLHLAAASRAAASDTHTDNTPADPNRLLLGLECKNLRKVYGVDPEDVKQEEEETTYYCGDVICQSDKLVRSRLEMKELVTSTKFEAFIYLMIALNMVAIIFDNERFHKNDEQLLRLLDMSNYAFCAIFSLELIYKLYGLNTRMYFKDPFNCFDFCLVIASYVEIIVVGGGASSAAKSAKGVKGVKAAKAAKLAKFARMGKMVRVLRIARLLRWFSYDETKSAVTIALSNLNLVAYQDEILALLGQNGAGKTTFFSMLMGISEPTAGVCMVDGIDILSSRDLVKKFVGSCPQHDILFDYYTIEEHLRLYATMHGIHPLDLDDAVLACLNHVGLTKKKDDFVNNLSGGMRRRTSIAMACLGNPKIILLDEPSAGVDIVNRQVVWKSLVELKKGRTIIMSTHFMEEAEILGDRVAVLKKGQLQVAGTCVELHNLFGAGYTLVINRPISGEAISHADATKELEQAKKNFIKKAAAVMDEEEAAKIADDVAKNFKKHLPPPENPVLKRKVALAALEVETALVREQEQAKLIPEKLLEFVRQHIPEADILEYTEDQAFLEYVLPFQARDKFADTFEALEKHKGDFGFTTFGISAPTLQEVFLEISDVDNSVQEEAQLAAQNDSHRRTSTRRCSTNKEVDNQLKAKDTRAIRRSSLSIIKSKGNEIDIEGLPSALDAPVSPTNAGGGERRGSVEAKMARREFVKQASTIVDGDHLHKKVKAKRQSMAMAMKGMPVQETDAHAAVEARRSSMKAAIQGEAGLEADDGDGEKMQAEKDRDQTVRKNVRRGSVMSKIGGLLGAKVQDGPRKERTKEEVEKEAKRKRTLERSSTQKYRKKKAIVWSEGIPYQSVRKQIRAMIVKRYIVGKRNRKGMLLQGVLPVFMVLMITLLLTINHEASNQFYTRSSMELVDNYGSADLELWTQDAAGNQAITTRAKSVFSSEVVTLTVNHEEEVQVENKDGTTEIIDYPQTVYASGDACLAGGNPNAAMDIKDSSCRAKGILAAFTDSSWNSGKTTWETSIAYNGTNLKSLPGLVNLASEAYMKEVLSTDLDLTNGNTAGSGITAYFQGFPMTRAQQDMSAFPPGLGLQVAIFIFISFASVTASQCYDAVAERESGCKKQQLISGVNPLAYWTANYLFDMLFFFSIPYASTVIIVVVFNVQPYNGNLGEFMTLLAYWGMSSPAFSYVASFIFARASTAQQMMVTLNTIIAVMFIGLVLLLESVIGEQIATPIRFVGMLFPNVCLGFSFWTFTMKGTLTTEGASISDDGMLPAYIMLGQSFVYFTLAIAMENTQDKAAKGYAKTKIGTMDEEAADSCQPSGPNAKFLREMTESSKFKGFIFGMIILNMVVVIIDMGNEGSDSASLSRVLIFDMLNYFFTLVFIAEMVFKLGGSGPIGYTADPFNIFDGMLVLLSIAEIFMAGNSTFTAARTGKVVGKSGRMLKLLRLFKFVRMLRILRYARFMQVAEYEVKQTAGQMMEIEKEELLRTKSSGRRESIVKRLSLLGGEYVEGSAVDVERKRITRRLSRRYTASSRSSLDDMEEGEETAAQVEEEAFERTERGDAVAINNLVKIFERPGLSPITATNDIGFGVRQGEIFSLLGPNGAGKSTVLNMMTGSVVPSSGEVYVLDKNITTQFDQISSRIGFCPQFDALVALMNSYETLTMFARIKGIPEEDIKPLVDSLINCIGLSRHAHKMSFQYSGGNKRKLSVAIALLANPDLVFLDEPSTGMDPASLTDVYSCVWMWTRSGKNRSIVLTTHSMEEADSLSNRIGILVNGKLAVLGTSQELKSSFGRNYTFEGTMAAGEDLADRVQALKGVIMENVPGSTDDGSFEGRVRYELPQDKLVLHHMFRVLEAKREELQIKDYTISQTTLEQVFIHFAQHQH